MLDASPQSPVINALSRKPLGRVRRRGAAPLLLSFVLSGTMGMLTTQALAQQGPPSNKTPPPGTMTGAYGQSLLPSISPNGSQISGGAKSPTTQTLALPSAQSKTLDTTPVAVASLDGGPTAANSSDPVSRFLQERGLLAQAQGESSKLLNQVRDGASDMVLSAMNFLGVRYTRGGNSAETGFDCSGFTRHIFENSVGLVLPRRADEQAKLPSLLQVKKEELKPGDLVFFNTMRRTFSHVGIYVGEGKFIHSPRVGGAVRVEDMREAYWSKRFTGARRADLKNATAKSATE